MISQQNLKRRVRDRMTRTGERYAEARRRVQQRAPDEAAGAAGGRRPHAAEPETGEDAVLEATGRGWDDWCDLIDAWPGHDESHGAVVDHLQQIHGLTSWWAQSVTVGWERITGRRLPYQQADGRFAAARTKTVTVDGAALRQLLLDADGREALFAGLSTELRSRPTSKNVRVAMEEGVAEIAIQPRGNGRVRVAVLHGALPSHTVVPAWQEYWSAWLEALDSGAAAD